MGTQMLAHGDVLRVFMRQAPLEPWIMERAAEKSKRTCAVFTQAMLEHRDEIRHEDPELAVDAAWRIVYNTTARRITHGPSFESTAATRRHATRQRDGADGERLPPVRVTALRRTVISGPERSSRARACRGPARARA